MFAMNLVGKFKLMIAVAAVGLAGLTGFWLSSQRSSLLGERIEKTKNLVEVPYSIITEQHRFEVEGKISREEAQKLRHFLDGRENLDRKGLASHRDCELGKWIYGGGMSAFSHLQEMSELEKKHADMHTLVKRVVELKHAGKAGEAEQQFSRVCEAAEEVVALITAVEAHVIGSRAPSAVGREFSGARRAVVDSAALPAAR